MKLTGACKSPGDGVPILLDPVKLVEEGALFLLGVKDKRHALADVVAEVLTAGNVSGGHVLDFNGGFAGQLKVPQLALLGKLWERKG